jgi:hypothetical protein
MARSDQASVPLASHPPERYKGNVEKGRIGLW